LVPPLFPSTLVRLLVHPLHGHHSSLHQKTSPRSGGIRHDQTTILPGLWPASLPQPTPCNGSPPSYPNIRLRPVLPHRDHAGQDDGVLEYGHEVDNKLLILHSSPN